VKIKLNDNETTLLLPLLGRAMESRKADPIFFDPLAADIIEKIDYDFDRLQGQITEYSRLSWAVRALRFKNIAAEFINVHPEATVVNLGAGLDTTFYMVDNGRIDWINVDSEEVNKLRVALLPVNQRVRNINGSVLDPRILDGIIAPHVLFMASGLLIYLAEDEIKQLFRGLADKFPSSTIAFDRISSQSIQYVQTDLSKTNLAGAKIRWGIDDAREMEKWDGRFKIVREEKMFAGVDRERILNADIIKVMDLNDQYNGSGIVVLSLG
jgi:O-methyltransferase involved in polyketide biosynthesis